MFDSSAVSWPRLLLISPLCTTAVPQRREKRPRRISWLRRLDYFVASAMGISRLPEVGHRAAATLCYKGRMSDVPEKSPRDSAIQMKLFVLLALGGHQPAIIFIADSLVLRPVPDGAVTLHIPPTIYTCAATMLRQVLSRGHPPRRHEPPK